MDLPRRYHILLPDLGPALLLSNHGAGDLCSYLTSSWRTPPRAQASIVALQPQAFPKLDQASVAALQPCYSRGSTKITGGIIEGVSPREKGVSCVWDCVVIRDCLGM